MQNRPSVGVAVIIAKDDYVLLIRRKNVHGAGSWSTPGGHLEFGESPEECAIREVKEETDIDITDIKFKAITNDVFSSEGKHYVTIWMEGSYSAGNPIVNDTDEIAEVKWFAWNSLPQVLFLPFQHLLSGKSYPRQTIP